MSRRCTICASDHVMALNVGLVEQEPVTRLARQYGVSRQALQRHKTKCLPKLLARSIEAQNCLSNYEEEERMKRMADYIAREREGKYKLIAETYDLSVEDVRYHAEHEMIRYVTCDSEDGWFDLPADGQFICCETPSEIELGRLKNREIKKRIGEKYYQEQKKMLEEMYPGVEARTALAKS